MKNLTRYSMGTLALAAVLVACSTGGKGSEEKRDRPERANIDAKTGHVSRPLDRYFLSPQDVLQIRKAEVSLTNRCMRDLHYESHPLPMPKMEREESNLSEFLVFPVSQVRKNGYEVTHKASDSKAEWSRRATRTQRGLLDGTLRHHNGKVVPKGGCSTFAAQALMKGTKPHRIRIDGMSITYDASATPDGLFDSVMSAMRYSTAVQSDSDERVKSVNEEWSSCMQEAGFQYASPQAAANDSRWSKGNEPTKLETTVAVADMGCKKEVRYLDTVVEVQSEHEREMIAKHSATISSLRKDSKVWLSNAEEEFNK
ncbi:hypothetical protein ABZ471_09760 [Streptomyces sp. NPDC005728]|uniref:hypothetical protein n=1 Tax=Streptomyces sp. NPDC005728 TaxID=3157054 RepID=UPI0033F069E4